MHASQARFDDWKQSLRTVCGDFNAAPSNHHSLFIGEVSSHEAGGLEMARIRTNAGWIARQKVNADRGEDKYCFLIVQRSGRQMMRQATTTFEMLPGDITLVDGGAPFGIEPCGLIENLSIHLKRDLVQRHLSSGARFGKLSASSSSTRLIKALLQPMCDGVLLMDTEREREALQEAIMTLAAAALASDGITTAVSADMLNERDLRSMAIHMINASLSDGNLSPGELAARLNVSLRRLYRAFEADGESVCRYIQMCRLQRVAADLIDPNLSNESITQIAFKWGFSDTAHFSRAFKRHYEQPPRDYRNIGKLHQPTTH